MLIGRLRSLAVSAVQAAAVVVLVLIFFSIFLGLLNIFFPMGSGMKELMKRDALFEPSTRQSKSGSRTLSGGAPGEGEVLPPLAATLTEVQNTVKSKRADEIAWVATGTGLPLYNRDAIQTFERARARITFDASNHLEMGENSLVILRRLEQSPQLKEKRAILVMVEGEMRGRIKAVGHEALQVNVVTAAVEAKILPRRGVDGNADFKITVNPDQSSTIAVYQGTAQVASQGKTVRIEENQAVTVIPGQAPTLPRPVPAAPVLTMPETSGVFYYRELPPRIDFGWKDAAAGRKYRFVLAKDAAFQDVIYDERLSHASFSHGNLKAGNYYWHVSGVDNWSEGGFSETRQFRVVQDRDPPPLMVQSIPEGVVAGRYVITGKTESGAQLFVLGAPVTIARSGDFSYDVQLQPGINMIMVEAVDAAANVTYYSQLVHVNDGRAHDKHTSDKEE